MSVSFTVSTLYSSGESLICVSLNGEGMSEGVDCGRVQEAVMAFSEALST
jgi:hypothetical protein